jgi:hypothetical protein
MSRDTVRALAIVVLIAAIATATTETSAVIASAIFGAISLLFVVLLWFFGYRWYEQNRMAISLMPDRERAILYAGMGAVTVTAALFSLAQFGLLSLGPFAFPLLIVFLGGAFAIFYAWQESKRYTL